MREGKSSHKKNFRVKISKHTIFSSNDLALKSKFKAFAATGFLAVALSGSICVDDPQACEVLSSEVANSGNVSL